MKTSIMSSTFLGWACGSRVPSLDEQISMVKSWGFDGFEIGDAQIPDPQKLDRKARKQLKQRFESEGLEIPIYSPSINFSDPNLVNRKEKITRYKSYIDFAAELNTKMVRFEVGLTFTEALPAEYQKCLQWGIEALKECAKKAENVDITLVLDNHYFAPIGLNANIIKDLGSPENIKMNVDCGNAAIMKDDYIGGVKKWSELVVHTHLKDYRELNLQPLTKEIIPGKHCVWFVDRSTMKIEWVPLGEGEIDIKGFIGALKEIGYEGFLSIEDFSAMEYKDISVRKGLTYLKKLGI